MPEPNPARKFVVTLIALAMLASAPAVAQTVIPSAKDHRQCINTLNKAYRKLAKLEGKEIARCIKRGSQRKLMGEPIEQCLTADSRDRLAKLRQKTRAKVAQRCLVLPDVGATDPNTITRVAIEQEIALAHTLFGNDLDLVIVDQKDPNEPSPKTSKAFAKCQTLGLKRVQQCRDAKLKAFNRCAKKRDFATHSPEDGGRTCISRTRLSGSWFMPHDPRKAALIKKCGRVGLRSGCTQFDRSDLFPGDCSNLDDTAQYRLCLQQRIDCQLCLALTEATALIRDCDDFDDGEVNGSCP